MSQETFKEMPVEKSEVLTSLRRVKGPDLESNIVDLGLVSEIFIKDDRVYFSITIPASRAEELEQLRKAAEKVVSEIKGVAGVSAVLTAEASSGAPRAPAPRAIPSIRVFRQRGPKAQRATPQGRVRPQRPERMAARGCKAYRASSM